MDCAISCCWAPRTKMFFQELERAIVKLAVSLVAPLVDVSIGLLVHGKV